MGWVQLDAIHLASGGALGRKTPGVGLCVGCAAHSTSHNEYHTDLGPGNKTGKISELRCMSPWSCTFVCIPPHSQPIRKTHTPIMRNGPAPLAASPLPEKQRLTNHRNRAKPS